MKRVLLLLAEGFEFYEASVFIDVIGWNREEGDKTTELFTCGLTREVSSAFNHRLIVDFLIGDVRADDFDALAIPGGFEIYGFYRSAYNEHFLNLIRAFRDQDKIIASVCVASIVLGKSGILIGKNATTYNMSPIRQETLRNFGANVINEPVVVDGKIISCWNPSTAMEAAFTLLEMLTTKPNADYIRKIMGFK